MVIDGANRRHGPDLYRSGANGVVFNRSRTNGADRARVYSCRTTRPNGADDSRPHRSHGANVNRPWPDRADFYRSRPDRSRFNRPWPDRSHRPNVHSARTNRPDIDGPRTDRADGCGDNGTDRSDFYRARSHGANNRRADRPNGSRFNRGRTAWTGRSHRPDRISDIRHQRFTTFLQIRMGR